MRLLKSVRSTRKRKAWGVSARLISVEHREARGAGGSGLETMRCRPLSRALINNQRFVLGLTPQALRSRLLRRLKGASQAGGLAGIN